MEVNEKGASKKYFTTVIQRQVVMITVVILGVVVVGLIVGEYVRVKKLVDVGIGLMNTAVPYEQHPEDSSTRLLLVGDSSAVGVGADTAEESVAGYLGDRFPDADITNWAVSGAKTEDVIAQLQRIPEEDHYDVILLHIGGNDIVRFVSFDDMEVNLHQALDIASTKADAVVHVHGGDIGTASLLPLPLRPVYTRRTYKFRELAQRVHENYGNVYYADILNGISEGEYTAHPDFTRFPNDPFHENPTQYLAADQFHPSSEGYKYWYQVITLVIENNALLQR